MASRGRGGQILKGLLGGAGAGSGIASLLGLSNPWSAAVTIGSGLLGGLFGSSEKTEEEIQEERYQKFLTSLREREKETLKRGRDIILKATEGTAARVRQGSARRAASMGLGSEAESFILPAQGDVIEKGFGALAGFTTDVENRFDQMETQASLDFAGRPIEPGATDYLLPIGSTLFGYAQDKALLDSLAPSTKQTGPENSPGSVTPSKVVSYGDSRVNDLFPEMFGKSSQVFDIEPEKMTRRKGYNPGTTYRFGAQ